MCIRDSTKAHIEHLSKQVLPAAAATARLNLDQAEFASIQLRRFIGPFYRCFDVYVPEWVPIIGAPDITFEVTQDVNGDGTQEVIYSEGYFDIRWDATSIPDVTLHASQIAVANLSCDTPPVSCDGSEPGIQFAGLMPLAAPYQDISSGYALRPNRPHTSGDISDPGPYPASTAPYTDTVQLYGCNHADGAAYYRVLYSFNGGATVPFMNSWLLSRFVGSPPMLEQLSVSPVDANGWYNIIPESDGWFPDHLLMNWPTQQEGVYGLTLQLADGAKNILYASPTSINVFVDNSAPVAQFTALSWQAIGSSASGTLNPDGGDCMVIERPAGHDIVISVTFNAYADHFRSVQLSAGGCGNDHTPVYVAGATEHWYTGTFDNNYSNATSPAEYRIPGSYPQGSYSLSLYATGRAFNPAGGDGGFQADWLYNPVYAWTNLSLSIAIVDV